MSKVIKERTGITIVKMALPMFAGTFAINMYNLTNVWFVSRLGTDSLAAISFAFPVIMMLTFIVRGIGTGVMSLTARLIGAKDTANTSRLVIHALIFAALTALVMSAAGIATAKLLFVKMGASGNTLFLTLEYMNIWYLGAVIMVTHMILGDIIMSTGNTKAISALMVCGTVLNIIFDIGLIFGKFGMPAMGIKGAALATIISQGFTLAGAVYILFFKLKIIVPVVIKIKEIKDSWIQIIKFAVPSSLGMIMTPVSAAVITKLVAGYGDEAVAAVGVAGRIEMFAFMIPMTVGMSLIPFVAQNYGAGRTDRIKEARVIAMSFAAIYGLFIAALFFIFSRPMADIFSNDPKVTDVLVLYIQITCAGYGMLEIHRYAGFCLLGMHAPVQASVLDIVRILVFLIPLSIIGEKLFNLNGIFTGRLLTDIAAGAAGIIWSGMVIRRKESMGNK